MKCPAQPSSLEGGKAGVRGDTGHGRWQRGLPKMSHGCPVSPVGATAQQSVAPGAVGGGRLLPPCPLAPYPSGSLSPCPHGPLSPPRPLKG